MEKIIVSFTSFGERLYNDAPIMVEHLFNQTKKADLIVMTLYKDDVKNISPKMQKFIDDKKVILQVVDENLKPHLKYYYTMINYRNDIIITLDDDHIYPDTLIEELYNSYLKYPYCISARRMHLITKDDLGMLLPYRRWHHEITPSGPVYNALPTGVGGILYPPNILKLTENNIDDIKKCINADDIYLRYLEYIYNIPAVYVPNTSNMGIDILSESARHNRLQDSNIKIGGGNDQYMKIFKIID